MSDKYKVRSDDVPYFITFAVEGWIDVFTRDLYRDIVLDSLRFCQKEKGLVIYAWCLMTNHIHLIVGRNEQETIDAIIRDFKKYTSVHICRAIEGNHLESRRSWMLDLFAKAAYESSKHQKYKFWQTAYHPVELFTREMMFQKTEYVHDNPVKAGFVSKPEDFVYSSARDYFGLKGLLKVEIAE